MSDDTKTTAVDVPALVRELLDGAEVQYGYPGERAESAQLPDGRVVKLAIRYDEDSGIGDWRDERGSGAHHDDVFGSFRWRGRDSTYGYPAERPRDFDGAARVFTRYGQGADRLEGSVLWQPPADVRGQANADEVIANLAKTIDAWFSGDWFHVGVVVSIHFRGEETGSASLWGIDYGLDDDSGYVREVAAELLAEAGIDDVPPAVTNESELLALAREFDEREGSGDDHESDDLLDIGRAMAAAILEGFGRETNDDE